MDFQTLINIGASSVLAGIGYLTAAGWARLRANESALTDLRIEIAKDYVTHTDLREIKEVLVRIETKLDGKADK